MEQNQGNSPIGGKSAEFAQKNRNYIVVAVVIVVLAIIYFASQDKTEKGQELASNGQKTEQTEGDKMDANDETDSTESGQDSIVTEDEPVMESAGLSQEASPVSGNISVAGTLRTTDNPTRGNLILETSKGKIYIHTKRDFFAWVGREVTLMAEGSIENFVFLGFKEAGSVAASAPAADANAMGGGADKPIMDKPGNTVSFSGNLGASDNAAKGNYLITSGATKVYIQSQRDYSDWLGADVTLNASGSLQAFTGAVLVKK